MNPLLFIVLIIAALGYVGSMGYNDELAQEQHYTDMVCAQVWPDYRGIEPECPKPKARPERY
jgi:hypothetical protein